MKVRDISLMASGAIISVAVIALAFALVNPPKAQAQSAAAAPGATTMIVQNNSGTTCEGLITINDPIGRKVTAVSYQTSFTTFGSPQIFLSPTNSFAY